LDHYFITVITVNQYFLGTYLLVLKVILIFSTYGITAVNAEENSYQQSQRKPFHSCTWTQNWWDFHHTNAFAIVLV